MTLPPEGFEPPQMPQHQEASAQPRPEPPAARDEIASHAETPHRSPGLLIGLGVGALVLIGALVVVVVVWGPGSPVNTAPSPTPSSRQGPTPGSSIELPETFDTYTLDRQSFTSAPLEPGDDVLTATGTYTQNGIPTLVVTVATPADSVPDYLLSLGASQVAAQGTAWCGIYQEVTLCGALREDRVYTASPLSDQSAEELARIVTLVAAA